MFFLVLLNFLPVVGVLVWGWTSFEIIFLYWLENVIIGVFVVLRMLMRPYPSFSELGSTLFISVFFTVHFGAFCWVHGSFLFSMFGPPSLDQLEVPAAAFQVLQVSGLFPAAFSLGLIQLVDALMDAMQKGIGAEPARDLMAKPYKRIVVLHVAIIAAGAALSAMNDPIIGLLLLIAVKTASDIWHWRRDDEEHAPDSTKASQRPL